MDNAVNTIPQRLMIERARAACLADERVVAALMYGSFTRGEGDAYSDIELALFFEDHILPRLDQRAWVTQIAPVLAYFSDTNRHHTAHFANLIRGEFHFKPVSAIKEIAEWRGNAWFPSLESTLLVDRTGDLTSVLAPMIDQHLSTTHRRRRSGWRSTSLMVLSLEQQSFCVASWHAHLRY